jgi:hypothetical protein
LRGAAGGSLFKRDLSTIVDFVLLPYHQDAQRADSHYGHHQ